MKSSCHFLFNRPGTSELNENSLTSKSKSKSKLSYDRRSVGQSLLASSTHLGLTTRFILLSDSCGFVDVGRSLTRERVCRLQLPLILASAVILGSESGGTRDHILLSQIRDSSSLESQVVVFISPRNRVAQLYPQALASLFVASYDSQGHGGGIRPRLHTCDPRSVSYTAQGRTTQKTFIA
jgi:hypothetical protein